MRLFRAFLSVTVSLLCVSLYHPLAEGQDGVGAQSGTAGSIYMLRPSEPAGDNPVPPGPSAPDEGAFPVPVGSWILMEFGNVPMNESFRNAVRIEDSNIVGLVPGGFREAIPMMIVEGRPVLPLMGTSNPTLILEAKAPGETSVTVRLGRKTVTYDVLVTGDEEALDQP